MCRLRTERTPRLVYSIPISFPIYEVGEHDGCPYLSMEFVDGIGLDEKIASPLTAQAAAEGY